ncbi:hypothetical protein P5V15_000534 [Pogonomyrmex californicus]
MEYGGGGGGARGGVQPPSAGARGIAGTDTTDAAWHKHEQMMLMESRHKQQCSSTPESCISVDAGRLAMRLGASRADSVPVHCGAVSRAAGSHRLFAVS